MFFSKRRRRKSIVCRTKDNNVCKKRIIITTSSQWENLSHLKLCLFALIIGSSRKDSKKEKGNITGTTKISRFSRICGSTSWSLIKEATSSLNRKGKIGGKDENAREKEAKEKRQLIDKWEEGKESQYVKKVYIRHRYIKGLLVLITTINVT